MNKRTIFIIAILLIIGIVTAIVALRGVSFGDRVDVSDEDSTATTQERPVRTLPPLQDSNDVDLDGILDAEEKTLGTSNYLNDTDGDGLSDKKEIEEWNTDPTKKDTDGDGFTDLFEIMNGYSPTGEGTLTTQ